MLQHWLQETHLLLLSWGLCTQPSSESAGSSHRLNGPRTSLFLQLTNRTPLSLVSETLSPLIQAMALAMGQENTCVHCSCRFISEEQKRACARPQPWGLHLWQGQKERTASQGGDILGQFLNEERAESVGGSGNSQWILRSVPKPGRSRLRKVVWLDFRKRGW